MVCIVVIELATAVMLFSQLPGLSQLLRTASEEEATLLNALLVDEFVLAYGPVGIEAPFGQLFVVSAQELTCFLHP